MAFGCADRFDSGAAFGRIFSDMTGFSKINEHAPLSIGAKKTSPDEITPKGNPGFYVRHPTNFYGEPKKLIECVCCSTRKGFSDELA